MRFNLASDWGQVFVGDTFEYVVTLQNAGNDAGGSGRMQQMSPSRRPKIEAPQDLPAINNVVIADELNPVFEIVGATSSGLKITTTGQKVEATRDTLAGGETVTLKITVRARAVDINGKTVLNQARLTFKGAGQPLFSNVVAVRIVTRDAPTPTIAPTSPPTATPVPLATAAAVTAGGDPISVPKEQLGTQLPKTSDGTPLWGFVLLGLTLFFHSLRAHRARIRI